MNKLIKFSIIVPIYNAERTLVLTVNSILSQNYKDFELLLIDDGSTDSSCLLCDMFTKLDSRVRTLHKKNGGVSAARNTGLSMAEGEWIVFVDADDMLECDWLGVFSGNINKFDCNVLLVQRAKMMQFNEIREVLHSQHVGFMDKEHYFRCGQYGYLWNKCFRADVIKANNILFDESMNCFEDELFVLEYAQNIKSIYILDTPPMYNYYVPEFDRKYKKDSTFTKQYYRYCRTKKMSYAASVILVDWLIMTMLHECADSSNKVKDYALAAKEAVGKDIEYASGIKKILLRSTRIIDLNAWWICMVWFYSRIYKLGLLK